jgi:hypothetical protein
MPLPGAAVIGLRPKLADEPGIRSNVAKFPLARST